MILEPSNSTKWVDMVKAMPAAQRPFALLASNWADRLETNDVFVGAESLREARMCAFTEFSHVWPYPADADEMAAQAAKLLVRSDWVYASRLRELLNGVYNFDSEPKNEGAKHHQIPDGQSQPKDKVSDPSNDKFELNLDLDDVRDAVNKVITAATTVLGALNVLGGIGVFKSKPASQKGPKDQP